MATSVIGSLATAIIPQAIPFAVKLVEKVFGDKNGATKKETAVKIVEAVKDGLVASGQTTAEQSPSADLIGALIETTVGELNSAGALNGASTLFGENNKDAMEGVSLILQGIVKVLDTSK